MKRNFSVLILSLLLLGATMPLQGAVTFQHTLGYAGNVDRNITTTGASNYVKIDSLQPVHEITLVIYAKEGNSVKLIPPGYFDDTFTSRSAFRRWYGYNEVTKTESTISGLNFSSEGFDTNNKGHIVLDKDVFPTYTFNGTRTFVYCDQSNYTDYNGNSSSTTFIEGTLSQRVIFDIRPATEMATEVAKYTTTSASNLTSASESYMEEYKRVAPLGRTLYFGPAYQFVGSGDKVYPNYYYTESNGLNNFVSETIRSASSSQNGERVTITWEWRSSATTAVTNLTTSNVINNQYIQASYSGSEKTVTYALVAKVQKETGTYYNKWNTTWRVSSTTYYKIAKFEVTFLDPKECGPIEKPTKAENLPQMKRLAYRDFNTFSNDPDFKKPGTTDPTFYTKHAEWFESTYGFYYAPLQSLMAKVNIHDGNYDPTFGDYTFLNNGNYLNAKWFERNVYNHGATGTIADAKEGYFLYVDGATRPGTVFNLQVHADLCAGVTLWFSGYVAVLNNTGNSPLINFAVEGRVSGGEYEPITTYISGELTSGDLSSGKWLHILFPVELEKEYDDYRLVITNKGQGASGNDFAIDDIGIYASAPPVSPIQATSSVCVDADGDDFTIYMRMEYEKSLNQGSRDIYYQWTDDKNNALELDYYGKSEDGQYGHVYIDGNNPTSNIYNNFQEFDNKFFTNPDQLPAIGYIKENGEWVIYVATRARLVPGQTYLIGAMAGSVESLGKSTCGVFSQLEIKGSMYMTINDARLLSGKEIDACGNRLIHFGVERLILMSNTTGMEEHKATCRANWLWGTPAYIDAPENNTLYGASYATIKDAIMNGTNPALLATLEGKGLYVPDVQQLPVYLSADMATRWLGYTAFPIMGTGFLLDDNGNKTDKEVEICPEPIIGEVNLSEVNNRNILRIGSKDETNIPDIVFANIRTIRVNKAQCDDAKGIRIPVYGEYTSSFKISSAELESTTASGVTKLSLPLSNSEFSDNTTEITLVGGANGTGQLQPGNEYVFVLHESNFSEKNCSTGATYFRIIVVPDRVEWSATANGVWNNDINWQTVDGKPAWCPLAGTDVILSESHYRLLPQEEELTEGANPYLSYDINYLASTCRNLYVPAGAALLNQHLLDMSGEAVVDMSVPTDQWVMCAMPLSGGVSGDFWAPAAGESSEPFAVATMSQTVGENAADRMVNRVWQSLYNKSMTNVTQDGKGVVVTSSTWTDPLNALITQYPAGMGVALWVENSEGGKSVSFRLPKTDTEYHYLQSGKWHQKSETIARSTNGLAYQKDMQISLTNDDASGDMFLFGNPTLAYIDMKELVDGNAELAGSWYVLTDNAAGLTTQELNANVENLSADGSDNSLLAPMRAVLLKRTEPSAELNIQLTPDMLTLPESSTLQNAPKRAKQRAQSYALYVSATSSDGFTSRAVLQNSWGATDEYRQGEDATVFLMDEWTTPFGIYTISADSKPLSINQFAEMSLIPLACYAQQKIDSLWVCFEGEADYVGKWHLYDVEEGTRTALSAGMNLRLQMPTDGGVRYYLEKPADITPLPTDDDSVDQTAEVRIVGGTGELYVRSNVNMAQIVVYDVLGRVVATEHRACSAQWKLPQGVYVVNVVIGDAKEASVILVR